MKSYSSYINGYDMYKLFNACNNLPLKSYKPEDIRLLFGITYFTALRMSEALALRGGDFNIDKKTIHLGDTKTDKNVTVVLHPNLIQPMRDYLYEHPEPTRFILGKKTSMSTVRNWLDILGAELQLESLTTSQNITKEKSKSHIFRKSFAKWLYEFTGHNIDIVMRLLRHSNRATTEIYLQLPQTVLYNLYYGKDNNEELEPLPDLYY